MVDIRSSHYNLIQCIQNDDDDISAEQALGQKATPESREEFNHVYRAIEQHETITEAEQH